MHLYDERASCGDHVLDFVAAVDLEGREARRVEVLADDHKPILLQRCTHGQSRVREGYARGIRGVRKGYARGTQGEREGYARGTHASSRGSYVKGDVTKGREGCSCLQPVRGDVRQALVRPLLAMQHRPADVRLPCRAAK